jgi:hypothetical protein
VCLFSYVCTFWCMPWYGRVDSPALVILFSLFKTKLTQQHSTNCAWTVEHWRTLKSTAVRLKYLRLYFSRKQVQTESLIPLLQEEWLRNLIALCCQSQGLTSRKLHRNTFKLERILFEVPMVLWEKFDYKWYRTQKSQYAH